VLAQDDKEWGVWTITSKLVKPCDIDARREKANLVCHQQHKINYAV